VPSSPSLQKNKIRKRKVKSEKIKEKKKIKIVSVQCPITISLEHGGLK